MGNQRISLIPAEPEPFAVDFTRTAVLVIDMQNAFVSRGGYFDLAGLDISPAREIITSCRLITRLSREKMIKIIYLQMGFGDDLSDLGGPNSPVFQKSRALKIMQDRPELKEKLQIFGSWGAEIIEELKPQPGDIVIRKRKHNGFIGTNLDFILNTHDIRYLLFTGIATNICVQATLSHAFSLGYFPLLVSDAVSPMGPALTQEATIINVKSSFGWVTTSENVAETLERWQPVT